MLKILLKFSILILLLNKAYSQQVDMLQSFNDFLKILYKPRIAILFVLNDENEKDLKTYEDVKK